MPSTGLVERGLRDLRLLHLALRGSRRLVAILALEERLSVRVEVELGDDAVRRVDAERNGGTWTTGTETGERGAADAAATQGETNM